MDVDIVMDSSAGASKQEEGNKMDTFPSSSSSSLFTFISPSTTTLLNPLRTSTTSHSTIQMVSDELLKQRNNKKIDHLTELFNTLNLPPPIRSNEPYKQIEWLLMKLEQVQGEERRNEMQKLDFGNELMCLVLSAPQSFSILQTLSEIINMHIKDQDNEEERLKEVMGKVDWTVGMKEVSATMLSFICISQPLLALPSLLQLDHFPYLSSLAIGYLHQYFASLLGTCFESFLNDFLYSPKNSKISTLMRLLSAPDVLPLLLKIAIGPHSSGLHQGHKILDFLVISRLFDTFDLDWHLFAPLPSLITSNIDQLEESIVDLVVLLQEAAQDARFAEFSENLLHSIFNRFYEGLLLVISGKSCGVLNSIRNLLKSRSVREKMSAERYSLLSSFESISCHFQPSNSPSIYMNNTQASNTVLRIEKWKRVSPCYDVEWNILESMISSTFTAKKSQEVQVQEEYQLNQLKDMTYDEIATLLENIYVTIKSGNISSSSIIKNLPLSWLLSLIDQCTLRVMYIAVEVARECMERCKTPLKLLYFSNLLIEYFEALCISHAIQNAPSTLSEPETLLASSISSMDQDNVPSTSNQNVPTSNDKMRALFPLLCISRSHPPILSNTISNVLKKLCSPDKLVNLTSRQMPLWSHHQQDHFNSTSSSSNSHSNPYPAFSTSSNHINDDLILLRGHKRGHESEKDFPSRSPIGRSPMDQSSLNHASSPPLHDYPTINSPFVSLEMQRDEVSGLKENSCYPDISPIHHASLDLLRLLDLLMDCKHTTENMEPFVDTFLILIDSKYPTPIWELYSDTLPKKSTLDRDVYLEQLFLKKPILLKMLELIAQVPVQLRRCLNVLKSLLIISIGNWNSDTSVDASSSFWYNSTMSLISILDKAEWLPPMLWHVQDIFQYCLPNEICLILLSVWKWIVDNPLEYHPKVLHPDGTCYFKRKWRTDESEAQQQWPFATIRYALRRNISKLSKNALHFYARIK